MDLIEERNFRKKLLEFVLPIAFQQFMLALVSASDAIMLGFVDQTLLSAVSLAGQVQFVLNLFLLPLPPPVFCEGGSDPPRRLLEIHIARTWQ